MRLTSEESEDIIRRITNANKEKPFFKSPVALVGGASTICLAILVFFWASYQPDIVQFKDVLTTLLVGFSCTALIYTSKTFQDNRDVNVYRVHLDVGKADKDVEIEKSKDLYKAKLFAFELMKDWHSAEMILHAGKARTILNQVQGDIVQYLENPDNSDERKSIMVLFNYFERVGLACQTKMADSLLLKSYFRGLFDSYYSNLESYISAKRGNGNPRLFEQYEKTVMAWRQS